MQKLIDAIRRRDHRDRNRKDSPLRPARGAVIVDTTKLDQDQVVKKLLSLIPAPAPAPRRKKKVGAP